MLVLALATTADFVVFKPIRLSALTLALVPELLGQGPQPLSALTPAPVRTSVTYGSAVVDRMDLYLPRSSPAELSSNDRYPAVLMVLGVNPLPLDDARVIRVATALSRLGLVVAAPESEQMRNWRIAPAEAPHLVEGFEVVAARPEVDPDRIGIAAFSVGAAVALLAVADPQIAGRVRFINAFGGFGDAETLLVDSATRTMVVEGIQQPWRMGGLAREMFLRVILGLVDEPDVHEQVRLRVEPLILGDGATPSSFEPAFAANLAGDALAAYRLATAPDRETALAALATLSRAERANLEGLSANRVASGLRAPVFLMHDESDTAIPFSQLAPLAAAIPPASLRRVTPFRFFDHVQPGAGIGLDALPELWKLDAHLSDVLFVAL
ncbi:MAG: hypothetical protein FJ038_06735 [Chloroflexi bacterium]|nr:hypothetical protein [Chloroflexota bacterium]